jgi:hypothetical protein
LLANFSSFSRCFSLMGFACVEAILNGTHKSTRRE